ncbi:mRNA cap guanine-N7 methyltransferase 1 [Tritrichomonas foetus]|uniref:mRNA cap guanine-N(7) methyltransferase n=1 Tax=Tritrichomonas foetus TaxID=1144522 RepID=A0A1J4KN02_9EUKA|nr:mRNA cap guanine-N7 methyltransferase 1 [Tritrichomonas foetus]|eukprot:OHT10765.1 mRNA cap guanine-N7 methyltransferase 1 [Tritrichomonas foetus]
MSCSLFEKIMIINFFVMSNEVAQAYDGIARTAAKVSVEERQNSPTIHLRQFNNWIKSTLIDRFCPSPNATILDCACGKGGDIPKWKLKNPNEFVFGDISIDSLKVAYQKYQKVKTQCRATFIGGDTFSCNISSMIPKDTRFHISSCQFAFHYSFRDEVLARSAVTNLCERLLPGGYVILTIPNACRIVKLLRENSSSRRIGNSLYYIERNFDMDNIPMFGAEYIFNLIESVNNCAEYLVHPAVMVSLFQENKCELVETYPFHDYYHETLKYFPAMAKLFSDLLLRLGVENAEMTQDEWDVISLYSFYVFKKSGVLPPMPEVARYKVPKGNTFEIIDAATGESTTYSVNS